MQEIWKFSPSSLEEVQFWQVWWSWAYCNCSIIWIACILWRTPEISASCPAKTAMSCLFVIKDDPMLTLVLAKCNTKRIWCKNCCGLYIVQQDRYLFFVQQFFVFCNLGLWSTTEHCGSRKGRMWLQRPRLALGRPLPTFSHFCTSYWSCPQKGVSENLHQMPSSWFLLENYASR